jgi:hypothetical protein
MTQPKLPVFLSASVPERQLWRYKPDPVAILEAVRALVAVTVRDRQLVFGGHPAISPMVENAARTLPMGSPTSGDLVESAEPTTAAGATAASNVFIYQSEFFFTMIPPEARKFENLIWTERDPNAPQDREACLLTMRRAMIGSRQFAAAIFVGGMDGVEKEWALFGDLQPNVPRFPIASTRGAAELLLGDYLQSGGGPGLVQRLAKDLQYRLLFHDLLG